MNLGWTEKTTNEKTFRDRGSKINENKRKTQRS